MLDLKGNIWPDSFLPACFKIKNKQTTKIELREILQVQCKTKQKQPSFFLNQLRIICQPSAPWFLNTLYVFPANKNILLQPSKSGNYPLLPSNSQIPLTFCRLSRIILGISLSCLCSFLQFPCLSLTFKTLTLLKIIRQLF